MSSLVSGWKRSLILSAAEGPPLSSGPRGLADICVVTELPFDDILDCR